MKSINELFRLLILANELDNNEKLALRFSDPDGVRSGKSGWSFGVCQYDTQNNAQSLACLIDCGFTSDEINGIVKQTIDVLPLTARLIAHKEIVAKYDELQLGYCVNSAMSVITAHGIPVSNPDGILALADYANQYGSIGPGFCEFMKGLDAEITGAGVLAWKLNHTKYGREHAADCRRRYTNLIKILAEAAP